MGADHARANDVWCQIQVECPARSDQAENGELFKPPHTLVALQGQEQFKNVQLYSDPYCAL